MSSLAGPISAAVHPPSATLTTETAVIIYVLICIFQGDTLAAQYITHTSGLTFLSIHRPRKMQARTVSIIIALGRLFTHAIAQDGQRGSKPPSKPSNSRVMDDTMGPAGIMWPPDRPWSADMDTQPPCGSRAPSANRTKYPLSAYPPQLECMAAYAFPCQRAARFHSPARTTTTKPASASLTPTV